MNDKEFRNALIFFVIAGFIFISIFIVSITPYSKSVRVQQEPNVYTNEIVTTSYLFHILGITTQYTLESNNDVYYDPYNETNYIDGVNNIPEVIYGDPDNPKYAYNQLVEVKEENAKINAEDNTDVDNSSEHSTVNDDSDHTEDVAHVCDD